MIHAFVWWNAFVVAAVVGLMVVVMVVLSVQVVVYLILAIAHSLVVVWYVLTVIRWIPTSPRVALFDPLYARNSGYLVITL